ncbi:MAG: hypothetical protein JNK82_42460 [Myxococcaceae bacterium]|nr:hypothetical protein [Myxococcaceae bacterium]
MFRSPCAIGVGLVLAGLSACSGRRPTPPLPDAGPIEFVGRACNVDAECGTLRCDKIRRQCICLTDDSCKPTDPMAAPRYCNNYTGLCVDEIAGCKADSECGNAQYCDPSIRACRPLKSFCEVCAANNECGGAGDNCITDTNLMLKFCGKACESSSDCPRGATCEDKEGAKQCWPSETSFPGQIATCRNFKGCTPDLGTTCNNDAECADSTQRCDPGQGRCVAIEQVCPFGTTCDPRVKICVTDCAIDADCGSSDLRCINRVCQPLDDCVRDNDCTANSFCAPPTSCGTSSCYACTEGAKICDGNGVRTCEREAGSGCTTWSDSVPCLNNLVCDEGACKPKNSADGGLSCAAVRGGNPVAKCAASTEPAPICLPGGLGEVECARLASDCTDWVPARGRCKPQCATDNECALGETCQMVGGRYKCRAGCSAHNGCASDQRCNATTKQCEGPMVGTARICQSSASCRTCETCDTMRLECVSAKTAFPHCVACGSPSECGGGTCVQVDDGRFCLRFCQTGSECPQGFVCLGLTGMSGQSVCVPSSRSCGGKCP